MFPNIVKPWSVWGNDELNVKCNPYLAVWGSSWASYDMSVMDNFDICLELSTVLTPWHLDTISMVCCEHMGSIIIGYSHLFVNQYLTRLSKVPTVAHKIESARSSLCLYDHINRNVLLVKLQGLYVCTISWITHGLLYHRMRGISCQLWHT